MLCKEKALALIPWKVRQMVNPGKKMKVKHNGINSPCPPSLSSVETWKSKFGSGDPSFWGRKGSRIKDFEGSFVG